MIKVANTFRITLAYMYHTSLSSWLEPQVLKSFDLSVTSSMVE